MASRSALRMEHRRISTFSSHRSGVLDKNSDTKEEKNPTLKFLYSSEVDSALNEYMAARRMKGLSMSAVTAKGAEVERGAWGNQIEFILTCVGYAVGLGNVWRFPFLAYEHGGGAFLVPYLIMLAFVGLPIFFFELCFGQFASLGPITIWKCVPIFKGLGVCMVAMSWMISLNYVIIITYSMYMFFASMTSDLPFSDCTHTWNTATCIRAEDLRILRGNETLLNETLEELGLEDIRGFSTPSEEYFYREVLEMSEGVEFTEGIVWQLACCLALVWMIVYMVLINGIGSLGKVMYFMSTFPYVVMTIMLIRGVTLEGASTGIEFYIEPKTDGLTEPDAWSDAATQIFRSLSACYGGLIAMASYNAFHNNVLRDSLIVPIINCSTSIYAGFAVFSVLGYLAEAKGVPVSEVAEGGPSLVFVVYPEAIAEMPVPTLWAVIFFFMLISLGFSSQFSIVESVFVALMDEFPGVLRKNRFRPIILRSIGCASFFCLCLWQVTNAGFYWMTLVDDYISSFPLLFIGFLEIVALNWVYSYKKFSEDVKLMIGRYPPIYFKACWVIITPGILFGVIIFRSIDFVPVSISDYHFPDWAHVIGWLVVSFGLFWLPALAIYQILVYKGGIFEAIKHLCQETEDWGPAAEENRTGRYAKKDGGLKQDPLSFYDNKAFNDL